MCPKHAPILVKNNVCTFILSINNNSRCPRNTLTHFHIFDIPRANSCYRQCMNIIFFTIFSHKIVLWIKHLHHKFLSIAWSMVYIEEREIKNELSKKESINWARSHIEHLHHCFSCNWGASKGNINLVIVVEYVDTIEQERNQAWRISHWGAP